MILLSIFAFDGTSCWPSISYPVKWYPACCLLSAWFPVRVDVWDCRCSATQNRTSMNAWEIQTWKVCQAKIIMFHIVRTCDWNNCRIRTGNDPWIQNMWDQEKRTEKPVWNYGWSSYGQNTSVAVSHIKTAAAWLASTCVSLPLYIESLLLQCASLVGRKKKNVRWLLLISAQETNCDLLSREVVKSQLNFADSRSF